MPLRTVYPSSNEYGIPDLLPELRLGTPPGVSAPVVVWGSTSRVSRVDGTWVHYTDDYRFAGQMREPTKLPSTLCAAAVEPNYSVVEETTRAEALWLTYCKRWLARTWQASGVSIWVDLCVAPCHQQVNLLGVPSGWQRFATAGFDRQVRDLDLELEEAVRLSAGAPFTLLVYGGGSEVKDWAASRNSVVHIPHRSTSRVRAGEGTRRRLSKDATAERLAGG